MIMPQTVQYNSALHIDTVRRALHSIEKKDDLQELENVSFFIECLILEKY